MKKALLLFLVALFMQTANAKIWLVDNNSTFFLTNVQDALDSSAFVAGDTVMVVGSSTLYGSITIVLPVTIIGEGINNISGQNTKFDIINIHCSNVQISGVDVNQLTLDTWVGSDTISDVLIERCKFNNGYSFVMNGRPNNSYHGLFKNIRIINNVFAGGGYFSLNDVDGPFNNSLVSYDSLIIENNIFSNYTFVRYLPQGNILGLDKVIINHNNFIFGSTSVFYGAGQFMIPVTDAKITNNIFHTSNANDCSNCDFLNNLTFNNGINDTLTSTGIVSGNIIGDSLLFANYAGGGFNFNQDFNLVNGSLAITAATDGSNIGTTGGIYPLTIGEGPRIPLVETVNISNVAVPQIEDFFLDLTARARRNFNDTEILQEIKYSFDTILPFGQGTDLLPFTQGLNVSYTDSIPPVVLDSGLHSITIIARDSKGAYSFPRTHTFNVCTYNNATANFAYYVSGQNVLFTNNSLNNVTNHWDFGDGDTTDIISPFHYYQTAGVFNTCLTSINPCSSETKCDSIIINGIQTIFPNQVANVGTFVFDIKGAGFINLDSLKLEQPGQQPLTFDSIIVLNNIYLKAIVTFNSVPLGNWDVKSYFNNGDSAILINAVNISNLIPTQLSVNVTGDNVLRIGFNQVYHIRISNSGNVDAYFPDVAISGLPAGTVFQFLTDSLYGGNHIPSFDTLNINFDSLKTVSNIDTITNTSFYLILPYKIPANGQITVDVIFHIPDTTVLHSHYKLRVSVGKPMYTSVSPEAMQKTTNNWMDCGVSILQAALVVASGGNAPSPACLIAVGDAATATYQEIRHLSKIKSNANYGILALWDLIEKNFALADILEYCAPDAKKKINPAFLLVSSFMAGFDIGHNCIPHQFSEYLGEYLFDLLVGNATDPNQKYGPGGNSTSHYITDNRELFYTINFENDSAATLPAQIIKVVDTLDVNKFDLSSFSFTNVGLGLKSISQTNTQSFFDDIDFSNELGVNARISGQLDLSNGVVTWLINTIDTATNQVLLNNAALGILPPDTASPKGQGSVSFRIKLLPHVTHLDTLRNSASIIFDNDAPIQTVWQNVIDTIKPISSLSTSSSITTTDSVLVTWSGSDVFSGIEQFTIFASTDSINYYVWLPSTGDTSAYYYKDSATTTVYFYSLAIDSAGNFEEPPLIYDASVTFLPLGIEENNQLQMIVKLFPNPANNTVSIFIKRFDKSKNDFNIIARDITGRTVRNEKLNITSDSTTIQLDISQFVNGIYFFEITDGEHRTFKKLIKN